MTNMGTSKPVHYECFSGGFSAPALVPEGGCQTRRKRSVTQWAIKAENAARVMSMSKLSSMSCLL